MMLTNTPLTDQGFFHFTLQGIGIFLAIFGIGMKIIRMLRKFDKGFDLFIWEHRVMWNHYVQHNSHTIPMYPALERRKHDRTQ